MVNFKVCKNGSFHLRGNVYIQYKSMESAVQAYDSINGRYFAGKQVRCEFVNVTKWKVAICGEYMKSRLKTCSHGTTCNFMHPFRNPGGDYEWADWDKPPPRFWVKKMAALFGYYDEYEHELMEQGQLKMSGTLAKLDRNRHRARRSRSEDGDGAIHTGSSSDNEDDVQKGIRLQRPTNGDGKHIKVVDKKLYEDMKMIKDYHHDKSTDYDPNSDRGWSDREIGRKYKHHDHARKRSRNHEKMSGWSTDHGESKDRSRDVNSDEWSDGGRNKRTLYDCTNDSGHDGEGLFLDDDKDTNNVDHIAYGYRLDKEREREKHHNRIGKSWRRQRKERSPGDVGDGKSRNDAGSSEERLYRSKDRCKKTTLHQDNVTEFAYDNLDDRYGTNGPKSDDDELDRDQRRHHSRRRRHSRCSELEFSTDKRLTARLKEQSRSGEYEGKSPIKRKSHSDASRSNLSIRKNYDADSLLESLELNERCESHNPDSRSNSIKEIDEQDRWEPAGPDRDWSTGRKFASVECDDSGSPGAYDGRSNSHAHSSDYFYHGKINRSNWNSEKDASEKYHKSRNNFTVASDDDDSEQYRGNSSSQDKSSGKLFSKSRSQGCSRSRHKRH